MYRLVILFFVVSFSFAGISCNDTPTHPDTLSSGEIDISADETYRDVIEAQKKVFDSSFPNAKVNIHYKPEGECFKDYFANKARLILVTRDLTKNEKEVCEQKQIYATALPVVKDAVAVILNNESPDSLLTVEQLKFILAGNYKNKYTVVFDNQSSSLLRYVTDSLMGGQKLGSNIFAAKSAAEVRSYILTNPKAIGFAGLCDVADSNDVNNTGAFIKNVKVVSLYNDSLKVYLQPFLAYIGLKEYPLIRKLYYVSRESHQGLGTGFANFLAGPRGQLIFAHAHLYPTQMEVTIRSAEINTGK